MKIRFPMIMAVAHAEIRSTRRQARYWLFTVLALFTCIAMYIQYTFLHGMASYQTATLSAMSPRYLIASTGMFMTMVFVAGLVFLAFDVRARDVRDRMSEILDSRPFSNTELLLGKTFGIVFMIWLPVVLITGAFQIFGTIAHLIELPMGDAIEPWSLAGFLVATLTTITLWSAVIILLSVILKHRLLVAIVGFGLAVLQFWTTMNMPIYLHGLITVLPLMDVASDLIPNSFPEGEPIRLLGHWFLAGALLAFAVALHPRRDGESFGYARGMGLLVIAGGLLGYHCFDFLSRLEQPNTWRAAHEARKAEPFGDMQSITGVLTIERGDSLALDLTIEVKADEPLESLLFTLNPGIEISQLEINGNDTEWYHENGLLEVSHSMPANTEALVHIVAAGTPHENFGYLDTYFNLLHASAMKAQLGLLGMQTSIFHKDYVAMPPGANWLPSTGTDVPQSDPRSHPYDYYQLDLEVVVPGDWLVAGPGIREQLSIDDDSVRYRFNPDAPVPHVGLFASEFERRSFQAAGVTFEVLYSADHEKNFTLFEPAAEKLEEIVGEMFTNAKNRGIPYPYDAFTFVETPNTLRGYGGGWPMDTVQTMPGVMMLRENSFPVARFEKPFGPDATWYKDQEGGLAGAQVEALQRFFERDFSGGNIFTGVVRNFFTFQTSAVGEGAHAVNFVLEDLTTYLLSKKRGYFSAHEFESANVIGGQVFASIMFGNTQSITEILIENVTSRSSVWDRALGTPLAMLEPNEDPAQVLNVLTLKGQAISQSLSTGLGFEDASKLVGTLVERYRGRHFNANDLHALADELELDLVPLLGDWLHDTALPGFLVSAADTVRITDNDQGRPRYQTTVHLRNDEPAPGLANFSYQWGQRKTMRWDGTAPIRVPGNSSVEVGVVTSTPIRQMYLQPYLSLNRVNVPIQINRPDSKTQVDIEPFVGSKPSDWQLPITDDIIIDDLDDGFLVQSDQKIPTERAYQGPGGFGTVKVDMDQGLPEHRAMFGNPQVWSRASNDRSWGKYRRTHALVSSGEGDQLAVFEVDLPHAGRWRLAYHLSRQFAGGMEKQRRIKRYAEKGSKKGGGDSERARRASFIAGQNMVGEFLMTLATNDESRDIEFDANFAVPGWNDLGEFDLPAGTTRLEISNANTGAVVVADAIRWRPTSQNARQKSTHRLPQSQEHQETRLARND